jgi:hypothetical protein
MQCRSCLEEIIDGALICRFCGKKQPLPAQQKSKHRLRRMGFVILSAIGIIALLMIWAAIDYQHEQARLRAAAACNGSLTAGQLEASARAAADTSGMSLTDAEHAAETLACPSMANR